MTRPLLRALVVLVLVVSLAGCSALGDDPTREERAVDALEDAHGALEDVDTYRYESDLSVADERRSIDVSVVGAVDHRNRTSYANATADGETLESYVDGRTRYEQCPSPWDGWHVDEVEAEDEDYWPDEAPARKQLSLFDAGDLYWNGTETIDGRETIRLTGSPPADALADDGSAGGFLFDLGGPSIDDASATLRLDAETKLPLEITLEFSVSDSEDTATASITTRYLAYGDEVDIDVPTVSDNEQYELGCPGA